MLAYDADGNLTNDGHWAYIWDAENRLVAMTNNTGIGAPVGLKFGYDWKGRRIQKQVYNQSSAPATNVLFVYDDWNPIAQLNALNNAVIQSVRLGPGLIGFGAGSRGCGWPPRSY